MEEEEEEEEEKGGIEAVLSLSYPIHSIFLLFPYFFFTLLFFGVENFRRGKVLIRNERREGCAVEESKEEGGKKGRKVFEKEEEN